MWIFLRDHFFCLLHYVRVLGKGARVGGGEEKGIKSQDFGQRKSKSRERMGILSRWEHCSVASQCWGHCSNPAGNAGLRCPLVREECAGGSWAKITVPPHRSSEADLMGTQTLPLLHALGLKGKQEVTTTSLMPVSDSSESTPRLKEGQIIKFSSYYKPRPELGSVHTHLIPRRGYISPPLQMGHLQLREKQFAHRNTACPSAESHQGEELQFKLDRPGFTCWPYTYWPCSLGHGLSAPAPSSLTLGAGTAAGSICLLGSVAMKISTVLGMAFGTKMPR